MLLLKCVSLTGPTEKMPGTTADLLQALAIKVRDYGGIQTIDLGSLTLSITGLSLRNC